MDFYYHPVLGLQYTGIGEIDNYGPLLIVPKLPPDFDKEKFMKEFTAAMSQAKNIFWVKSEPEFKYIFPQITTNAKID